MKRYRKIVILISLILMIGVVTTCVTVYKADNQSNIEVDKSIGLESEQPVSIDINKDTL